MIADRSNPVRTVSRTKWATCPEGTKSWIDGGSSQTWSTSQARNVLLIPRLNHDAPSSSRKIRLLGQAPSRGRSSSPTSTLGPGEKSLSAGETSRTFLHKGSRSFAQILGDEGAGLRQSLVVERRCQG